MSLESWSYVATIFGAFSVVLGILIIYFGKVSLKSKKEITKDWVSEVLSGTLFISLILIAGVIVFIIPRIILEAIRLNNIWQTSLKYLFYLVPFLLQATIFYFLDERINERTKFKIFKKINPEIILFSALTISITYFFFYMKNYFFFVSSFIFTYLILTYLSAIYGKETKESNHNKFLKFVFINRKEKPIIAKIKRLGDEFIDIIPKGEEDNEENKISINKSQIFSIKKLENKK